MLDLRYLDSGARQYINSSKRLGLKALAAERGASARPSSTMKPHPAVKNGKYVEETRRAEAPKLG